MMSDWKSELCGNRAASSDSQGDAVIEVKGNKPSVTVSWDKNGEEEEAADGNMETKINLTVGQKQKTLKGTAGEDVSER